MADDRDHAGWALASFLFGALIGAGLVLLLTPEPGQEIRAKLKEEAGKAKEAALRKTSELVEEIRRRRAARESMTEEGV